MPMCPNGHQSGTDDWCEICGMRMAAPSSTYGSRPPSSASSSSTSPSSAPPSSPSPPGYGGSGYEADPAAVAEVCPQCGTPREGAALFCEECRYNFRTHSPTVAPTGPGGPGAPGGPPPSPTAPGFPPYQRYESQRSRPSQINRPAEPVPSESVTVTSGSGDFLLDPPSRPVQPVQPAAGTSAHSAPPAAPPPSHTVAPPVAPATATGLAGPAAPAADPLTSPLPSPAQGGAGPAGAGAGTSVAGPDSAGLSGPVSRTAWVAVIAADREYFTAMMARSGPEAEGLYFPAFSPEVRLPLTGNQITIGRRRHSTGEAPDIDLARAPEDPGVSHQHAVLVRQPDDTWAVVDQDSTNGTTVNLGEDPIRPYTPVPLDEGDRVHVGAWTTITLRRA
ncbi:FHA domain-containing protein [Streptomyces sp. V4-01]|uniref:FHA domain-containing protein n=1 Tax=Actinacidiphila polyblastidii TaxID=3110430 RepID=A0ABU7P898_9ACTN|nr:FHA domain-containing protein [Streptomyces sp. V4-01]